MMLMISALLLAVDGGERDGQPQPFTSGWRFFRGDGNFAAMESDDTAWALVDIPHDYSAEDLPERQLDESTPVLAVRTGDWKFAEGEGNASWAAATFDDSAWRTVAVPGDWRDLGYEVPNAFGWYRRSFEVTTAQFNAAQRGTLRLALGDVASADVTYVNGIQVGATGSMGKERSCKEQLTYRSYDGDALSKSVKLGTNVIAVQVWSPGGPRRSSAAGPPFVHTAGALPAGSDVREEQTMHVADALAQCNRSASCLGITFRATLATPAQPVKVYFKGETVANAAAGWQSWVKPRGHPAGLVDAEAVDGRYGPFDAGASPGQRQTGYTVGGVGWYRKRFETPAAALQTPGSSVYLFIEGCYMNCQLHLNGHTLGPAHPYGYDTCTCTCTCTCTGTCTCTCTCTGTCTCTCTCTCTVLPIRAWRAHHLPQLPPPLPPELRLKLRSTRLSI